MPSAPASPDDRDAATAAARRITPDDLDLLNETSIVLTVEALGYGPGTRPLPSSSTGLTAWQVRGGIGSRIPIDAVARPVHAYAQALSAALAHDAPNLHALIRSATRSSTPAELLEPLRHCVHNAGCAITCSRQSP